MKKIIYLFPLLLILSACQHNLVPDVSCRIDLDPANTYMAGDPVRFVIHGNPDNILFYSGETGAQYRFRDRYLVPVEQVKSASLKMDYRPNYGLPEGLSVYVSNTFKGLRGDDGEADRATVAAMAEGGMQGWTRLDYVEGAPAVWTSQEYDMSAYLDNFALAIHWNPINDGRSAQRTYWLNGSMTIDIEGADPSTMLITDLNPVVLAMNAEVEPYHKNAGNGSVRFDNTAAQIVCQGIGAGVLDYAIDAWIFTTPAPLNRVPNDKGTVLKNLQNYMDSFAYTYEYPGTYTASFVCINANYKGSSRVDVEIPVTIMEKF
ncbi:MAG: DUF5017 domain-containing protein [Bacteroidales bacterium]|nr:DUF5017 domain-containing protein [Bacteroidales bacterium]